MSRKKWGLAGLGLALTLAACSSSGHKAAAPLSSTTLAPSTSTSAGTTVPASASSTTTAASGATTSSTAGSVRCATSSLSGSLTNENGTAGSVYYTLRVTNRGTTPCVVQGWPGVSFVASQGGSQIGAPAARIPGSAPAVTIGPGLAAGATLQITEATNYGSACQVTQVSGLRVYPPNQTASLYVPHTDNACANTTDVTLHVGAFQPSDAG